MLKTNLWIITDIIEYLSELEKSKKFFTKPTDFTRNYTFTFMTVFGIIINLARKSLALEIDQSLLKINSLLGLKEVGTKGGFSKARKKIKKDLFISVNDRLVNNFYSSIRRLSIKKWNGFVLKAVDGSVVNIFDTAANRLFFGEGGNERTVCQARMLVSYDPLNGLIDKAQLGHLKVGENTMAKDWAANRNSEELCIYDRCFPGLELQYLHEYSKSSYLMRCKSTHNKVVKVFLASGKQDVVISQILPDSVLKALKERGIEVVNGNCIKVRLLRVILDTGEIEVLMTNLIDQQKYAYGLFAELYFLRWGSETIIGFLKNTLLIEIASGINPLAIEQDFWGTIIRANIQAIIEEDTVPVIKQKCKRRKHNYQVNRTVASGNLKSMLANLLFSKNSAKQYQKIISTFCRHLEPIRKNRKYKRNIKTYRRNRGKYIPLKNYKMAI